jgi:hypothetical protein
VGLDKLVKKHPSLLGFSLESHKEGVAWLQKRLVLDDTSLSKLMRKVPAVLGCSIELGAAKRLGKADGEGAVDGQDEGPEDDALFKLGWLQGDKQG